ncbi:MAG: transcriptional regulator [Mesorhizobium amorphae]|nr:MAG: transcriptional regulator [Mesorhizobium amorphae]
MADLRSNLAFNLRRLCAERSLSISEACRGIGINRSQFERYLEAKGLPHKSTAARICDFFGVTESALYAPPPRQRPAREEPSFAERGEMLRRFASPKPGIEEGYYFTFFPALKEPNSAICSVTVVRHEEDAVTFRRMTGLAERMGSYFSYAKGDHRGLVVQRLNHFYFMAINLGAAREPSLLVMAWEQLSEPVLSGKGSVMTEAGPVSVPVAMRPAPSDMSLLRVLRAAHSYRLNDEFVGELVAEILLRSPPVR